MNIRRHLAELETNKLSGLRHARLSLVICLDRRHLLHDRWQFRARSQMLGHPPAPLWRAAGAKEPARQFHGGFGGGARRNRHPEIAAIGAADQALSAAFNPNIGRDILQNGRWPTIHREPELAGQGRCVGRGH